MKLEIISSERTWNQKIKCNLLDTKAARSIISSPLAMGCHLKPRGLMFQGIIGKTVLSCGSV